MKKFRYCLDKSAKKFSCPACCEKRLGRYVDQENKSYLATHVGRCDREINCGYHYTPK